MDGPRRRGYGARNRYDIRTRCIRGRLERRQGVSPGWIRQPFSDKSLGGGSWSPTWVDLYKINHLGKARRNALASFGPKRAVWGNELLPKGKEGKQKETPISPLASPSQA